MTGILSRLSGAPKPVTPEKNEDSAPSEEEECKLEDANINDIQADYGDAYADFGKSLAVNVENEHQRGRILEPYSLPTEIWEDAINQKSESDFEFLTKETRSALGGTNSRTKETRSALDCTNKSTKETRSALEGTNKSTKERNLHLHDALHQFESCSVTLRRLFGRFSSKHQKRLFMSFAQYTKFCKSFNLTPNPFPTQLILKSMQAALTFIKEEHDEENAGVVLPGGQLHEVLVRSTQTEPIEHGLPFRGFTRALGELAILLPKTTAGTSVQGQLNGQSCALAILFLLDAKCGLFRQLDGLKVKYPLAYSLSNNTAAPTTTQKGTEPSSPHETLSTVQKDLSTSFEALRVNNPQGEEPVRFLTTAIKNTSVQDVPNSSQSNITFSATAQEEILYNAGMAAMRSSVRKSKNTNPNAHTPTIPINRKAEFEARTKRTKKKKLVDSKAFVARMEQAEVERKQKLKKLQHDKLSQEAAETRRHIPRVNVASKIMVEDQTQEQLFERLHNSRKVFLEKKKKYFHDMTFRDPETGQEYFKPKILKAKTSQTASSEESRCKDPEPKATRRTSEALYSNAMAKLTRRRSTEEQLQKSLKDKREAPKMGKQSAKYVARRVTKQVTWAFQKFAERETNPTWVNASSPDGGSPSGSGAVLPFRSLGDVLRALGYFYSGDITLMPANQREEEREIQLKLWSELVQPGEHGCTGITLENLVDFCQEVVMPGIHRGGESTKPSFRQLMSSNPLRNELLAEFRRREVSRKAYAGGLSSTYELLEAEEQSVDTGSSGETGETGNEEDAPFRPQINAYSRALDNAASYRWENGERIRREELILRRHRIAEARKDYLRREKSRKEMEGCTFKPSLNKPKKGKEEPRHVTKARLEGRLKMPLNITEFRTSEEIELQENCTFKPRIPSSIAKKKVGSVAKPLDACHVPKDFTKTIERLRKGRQERERINRALERGREVPKSQAKRNKRGEVIVEPFTFESEKRKGTSGRVAGSSTAGKACGKRHHDANPSECDTRTSVPQSRGNLSQIPLLQTRAPPSPVPPLHLLSQLTSPGNVPQTQPVSKLGVSALPEPHGPVDESLFDEPNKNEGSMYTAPENSFEIFQSNGSVEKDRFDTGFGCREYLDHESASRDTHHQPDSATQMSYHQSASGVTNNEATGPREDHKWDVTKSSLGNSEDSCEDFENMVASDEGKAAGSPAENLSNDEYSHECFGDIQTRSSSNTRPSTSDSLSCSGNAEQQYIERTARRNLSNTPLLYVDISVRPGQQERIAVYEDDDVCQVAAEFAKTHGLNDAVEHKLVSLLQNQMSMVLQIGEECSGDEAS